MKKLLALALFLAPVFGIAQFPRVDMPGTEVRKITSSIVAGQEYELHIMFPGGYTNSQKKYPVVYLMDSQWDFPLVKSIYGEQYYDGFIPEMIIVGVTWGGRNPNHDSLRARDYTPTKEARLPQSGGAKEFLAFMKKELFPFIESNYKADKNERVLMGCSLGGLFTLFALFTEPELFKGYVAASPAIGWDRYVINSYEKKYFETHSSAPARLYLTEGDVEPGVPLYNTFIKTLSSRNYQPVKIRSKILENTGHSGTKNETYARGLQFVYERPSLSLNNDQLTKYAGSYKASNGGTVELKAEDGRLNFYFSPQYKYLLHAETETKFYSTAEFFNLEFINNGFVLKRYGSSQEYRRE